MTAASKDEEGFALLEVLVAFAIVTLGLVSIYAAVAGHFRAKREVVARQAALADTASHLDLIGTQAIAEEGTIDGTYDDGIRWKLTVTEMAAAGVTLARPMRVVLQAFDQRGKPLLRLKTVRFAVRPQ